MNIPSTITAGDSMSWADTPFGDALGASVDSFVTPFTARNMKLKFGAKKD